MDPNEALTAIVRAALEGDADELLFHAEALAEWLLKGGFSPTHEALIPVLSPAS